MLAKCYFLILIILSVFSLQKSQAQVSDTFTGNGADENISTGANWLSGSKPVVSDADITIASEKTMVIDENFSCKTLRINADASFYCNGGILTVSEGIYDKNGNLAIDINGSMQISSSIQVDLPTKGTFTDSRDSHTYNWVRIGTQVWMAENLAYLPSVSPPSDGSETDPYYYVYEYIGTSVSSAKASGRFLKYGVLYNWSAALAGAGSSSANPSGVQGACPSGWHLPSDAEWKQLEMFIGMSQSEADGVTGRGTDEGDKLKSSTSEWVDSGMGTDDCGFAGLPGGHRYFTGHFSDVRTHGVWWSATEYSGSSAWNRMLTYFENGIIRNYPTKAYGFSIRCVRD